MGSYEYTINALPSGPIDLGCLGENEATAIHFNMLPWLMEYPDMTFLISMCPPGGKKPYPVSGVTLQGNVLTWVVGAGATAKSGRGTIVIRGTQGAIEVRSKKMDVFVGDGHTALSAPPTLVQDWIHEIATVTYRGHTNTQQAINNVIAKEIDGLHSPWRKIADIVLDEDVSYIEVTRDCEGNPFELEALRIYSAIQPTDVQVGGKLLVVDRDEETYHNTSSGAYPMSVTSGISYALSEWRYECGRWHVEVVQATYVVETVPYRKSVGCDFSQAREIRVIRGFKLQPDRGNARIWPAGSTFQIWGIDKL